MQRSHSTTPITVTRLYARLARLPSLLITMASRNNALREPAECSAPRDRQSCQEKPARVIHSGNNRIVDSRWTLNHSFVVANRLHTSMLSVVTSKHTAEMASRNGRPFLPGNQIGVTERSVPLKAHDKRECARRVDARTAVTRPRWEPLERCGVDSLQLRASEPIYCAVWACGAGGCACGRGAAGFFGVSFFPGARMACSVLPSIRGMNSTTPFSPMS